MSFPSLSLTRPLQAQIPVAPLIPPAQPPPLPLTRITPAPVPAPLLQALQQTLILIYGKLGVV